MIGFAASIAVCLDSYAAFAHVADSLLHLSLGFPANETSSSATESLTTLDSPRIDKTSKATELTRTTLGSVTVPLGPNIRSTASALPGPLAQALWLVDVCGASYVEAASEAQCSPSEFSERVSQARLQIRSLIWPR